MTCVMKLVGIDLAALMENGSIFSSLIFSRWEYCHIYPVKCDIREEFIQFYDPIDF